MPSNIPSVPPSIGCSPKERKNWILVRLKLIMSAYRKDDFQDPDAYAVQAGMLLERFSNDVIVQVTDPVTGIQSHVKFPPSLAELREFCDELSRRSNYANQWNAQLRKQLEERDEFDRDGLRESPEERARIVDRIKTEMRFKGFQFSEDLVRSARSKPWKRYTNDELRALYAKPSEKSA